MFDPGLHENEGNQNVTDLSANTGGAFGIIG